MGVGATAWSGVGRRKQICVLRCIKNTYLRNNSDEQSQFPIRVAAMDGVEGSGGGGGDYLPSEGRFVRTYLRMYPASFSPANWKRYKKFLVVRSKIIRDIGDN